MIKVISEIERQAIAADHYDSFRFHMKTLLWIFLDN